jgi:hypothetical protein
MKAIYWVAIALTYSCGSVRESVHTPGGDVLDRSKIHYLYDYGCNCYVPGMVMGEIPLSADVRNVRLGDEHTVMGRVTDRASADPFVGARIDHVLDRNDTLQIIRSIAQTDSTGSFNVVIDATNGNEKEARHGIVLNALGFEPAYYPF